MVIAVVLALLPAAAVRAEDWPQWRGPDRDGAWKEAGILQTFPGAGLEARWRVSGGWGYSSPVVAGGRVYLTDAEVVGLNARERVHCFDEQSGRRLWDHAYDVTYAESGFIDEKNKSGPVATPVVRDGRLYTLGKCGHLICFDAAKGAVLWRKDLAADFPAKPLACDASPLVEGELLIAVIGAKPGACVVAFDKATGKRVWAALDDTATHSSPVVVTAGGARQLIVWTQESITSLDPATGGTHWRQRLATNSDYVVSTPVVRGDLLLIGGLMMKLDADKPAASVLWPRSRAVAGRVLSNTSTPLLGRDCVFSAKSSGQLVCLDAATGEQLWETGKVTDLKNGASIHLTPNGGSVLLYNDRGELIRAALTREGYRELGRVRLLEPTYPFGGRKCAWAPPAYANGCVFARSDVELACYSLAATDGRPGASP
jgi:outer membrane protein assembly factor BamB